MDPDLEAGISEYVEWAAEHPEEVAAQVEIESAADALAGGADPWQLWQGEEL